MCPMDDSTTNSEPRNPAIVFALAGDSTITRGEPERAPEARVGVDDDCAMTRHVGTFCAPTRTAEAD